MPGPVILPPFKEDEQEEIEETEENNNSEIIPWERVDPFPIKSTYFTKYYE